MRNEMEQHSQNIEEENELQLYGGEEPNNKEPFDPRQVDIVPRTMVITNIVDRLEFGGIDLEPDYQRRANLWSEKQQSRLIESLIIRIPLPSFYFDGDDEDVYVVVDGLQRLFAIKRFMVDKDLRLTGLEYLKEFEGFCYDDLPKPIQRRIRENEIMVFLIRKGTPPRVRISIFTRINTGGMVLTPAEIKNSVYRGQAAKLLRDLAASKEFRKVTREKVNPDRMEDCEFVNRFMAFYLFDIDDYKGNLEDQLNDAMIMLQKATTQQIESYKRDFIISMQRCYQIFGEIAFRKIDKNGKYGRINKPLYESVSVTFAKMSDKEFDKLSQNKEVWLKKYNDLLNDEKFVGYITNGTAKVDSVKNRYCLLDTKLMECIY